MCNYTLTVWDQKYQMKSFQVEEQTVKNEENKFEILASKDVTDFSQLLQIKINKIGIKKAFILKNIDIILDEDNIVKVRKDCQIQMSFEDIFEITEYMYLK